MIQSESLNLEPMIELESCQVGIEGNRLHRVVVEPCTLKVRYEATVELKPEVDRPNEISEISAARMPADVLTYLNPSRYCESDLLARFALEEFGDHPRGYQRVKAICDWVFEHLDYTPGSTNSLTTASAVLLQRTGVCRDYAHLAISLCRGIGIPARYIAGYAIELQPPDFHGFMEAFLDGQWYLFDPTRLAPVGGLVRIGCGRDAADVSFATFTGDAKLVDQCVWAKTSASNQDAIESNPGVCAVSTA